MNHAVCIAVAAFLFLPSAFAADPSLSIDYEGFTVWLNCQEHALGTTKGPKGIARRRERR